MSEFAQSIWHLKYQAVMDGNVFDSTIEDTWRRVASAISLAEKPSERRVWESRFYLALEGFRFLPGGRILASAGIDHQYTLFNCFVMNIAEDSLQGAFEALAEGEMTLKAGGGIGYDFSVFRPRGDEADRQGVAARGPVALMRLWDTMSSSLQAANQRRGAMMAVLRCDHPDIEEFIAAKSKARLLTNFNLSVMVTDAFMEAVANDADWPLKFPVAEGRIVHRQQRVYRHVKARELWESIIRAAYEYAEPGVLFADTINRLNNLSYCEHIAATNPCGEIPLPPYGACNLGSLNLTQFVVAAFTPKASMNWIALEETTAIAVRFLDNVIDVSNYPLEQQRHQALSTRRIGLGVSGLADALVMLGLDYSSEAAVALAAEMMRRIADVSWQVSSELAKEKGSFKLYQPAYMQTEFVSQLPKDLIKLIGKNGMRNSHHNAIAPTGTISLLANNISNGIEPIFRPSYQRKLKVSAYEERDVAVSDYAYELWKKQRQAGGDLPLAWQDVSSLTPLDHLNMQAAMQPYVDSAISKTINLSVDFPFERVMDIYTKAYHLGLKGCTIFRPNQITGSVLAETDVGDRCCKL